MTESQITGVVLAVISLTTLAGLALVVVPAIVGAAPVVCEDGSGRFACSGAGGILLWDLPLLGVPAVWLVGVAGIALHRGRRLRWTGGAIAIMVLLYVVDYWIAIA
jgi:hypothetical protein